MNMSNETDNRIRATQLIPVSSIHPNDWNPNEESPHTFNELYKEIQEDGFDHPLAVVLYTDH